MVRTKDQLKTFFETGDYPTQEQFADLIDSLAHVNDLPTGPVPDDLKLVVGTDIGDDMNEIIHPMLLNRRYRVTRNNTRMTDWSYLVDGPFDKIGISFGPTEGNTVLGEIFLIEFY